MCSSPTTVSTHPPPPHHHPAAPSIIPRYSLSSLLVLSHYYHHHPPSSPHSLRRPLLPSSTHRSFPPLSPNHFGFACPSEAPALAQLLPVVVASSTGSSLPSLASPCLWPAWPKTISPVAPKHTLATHNIHTHTHHVPLTKTYLDPYHHPRTTQQAASGQVSVGSTSRSKSHTTQHFPRCLPSLILHTSSDLHEPRQLQQHPLDQTHRRHYTPPSLQYQLQTPTPRD